MINITDLSDEQADKLGQKFADVLELKRDSEHPRTRWKTAWGSKTNMGLARTIAGIIIQFEQ